MSKDIVKIVSNLNVVTFSEAKEILKEEAEKLALVPVSEENLKVAKGAGTTLNKATTVVKDFYKEKVKPIKQEIDELNRQRDELVKILQDARGKITSSLKDIEEKRIKAANEAVAQFYHETIKKIEAEDGVKLSFDIIDLFKIGSVNFKKGSLYDVTGLKSDTKKEIEQRAKIALMEHKQAELERKEAEARKQAEIERIKREAVQEHEEKVRAKIETSKPTQPIRKDEAKTEFEVIIRVKTKQPASAEAVEDWVKRQIDKTGLKGSEVEVR